MAKGFGIHGSTTDHGGVVISTQSRSSQMGNLFLRAGDGFACPKCKCWSTLIKSNDHVIFDGKAVAYMGDKFTCGATLLPKQMLVVGESGGGAVGPTTSSANSFSNNNSNFTDKSTDSFIELQTVRSDKFVPLGVPSFEGEPSKAHLAFAYKVKKGTFEKISLEVEYNGNYVEVQKLEKLFNVGDTGVIKWDGFVKDTYNSNFMTNPKGVKFRIKGFFCGYEKATDEKIFIFEYCDKNWMDVIINKRTKNIIINLRVSFQDNGDIGLAGVGPDLVPKAVLQQFNKPSLKQRTESYDQLKKIALDGMNYYWSRNRNHLVGKNITVNGQPYEVTVNAVESSKMCMPKILLMFSSNIEPPRSCNWAVLRIAYYITGYLEFTYWLKINSWTYWDKNRSDNDFKYTFAHEMGHEILLAYGGESYSKKHKGSSTLISQSPATGTTYPRTGEIDLMKYADENTTDPSIQQFFERSVAANEDVASLMYISGIKRK